MRRNARQRAAACLLASLAQAGFIALLVQSSTQHVSRPVGDRQLIFVLPIVQKQSPTLRESSKNRRRTIRPALITERMESLQSPEPSPIPPAPAFPPSAQPAASPGVDWYALMESEAGKAADRTVERELHGDLLDSKPRVLDMPERPHRPGDEERYPDGAVLTWLNERCYVMLDPAGSGPRPFKVCKELTLAERRAEANRKQREQAMVPGYIRKAVPKPQPR